MIHTIDLKFLGAEAAIAAYVIPTENGAVLIECGPHATLPNLLAGLNQLGLEPEDIHTLLLTHIHFDHAGAAWWFAQRGTAVYVHPRGHRHLLQPERLYNSAKMIYGDRMDELWGEMHPIAPAQLTAVEDGGKVEADGLSFTAIHSPGHAVHHIAWEQGEVLFTGDVGGVKILDGPVVPPCPPPDINAEDWVTSVEAMLARKAKRWYLTHYGFIDEPEQHATALLKRLENYVAWMKPYAEAGTPAEEIVTAFMAFADAELRDKGVGASTIAAYRAANPPDMSVAGLLRYWHKKMEG
jgi:glyoxylase-like metal-dependent hydrolase (beta-lactamase superfamily II)